MRRYVSTNAFLLGLAAAAALSRAHGLKQVAPQGGPTPKAIQPERGERVRDRHTHAEPWRRGNRHYRRGC